MKHAKFPQWSYLPQYFAYKKELMRSIEKVLRSGRVITGTQLETFEKECAQFCKVKYAIGVASGTDALFLSLLALGAKPGVEVITVANTAIPTVSAIVATGATPVFIDIDPVTYLMDANRLEKAITKKTKIIVPVHLYGQCADMTRIMQIAKKYHLAVLEDAAQAFGATWKRKPAGSFGDMGIFSFYPTKTLGAYGDGGMIVTNNARLAKKVTMLRLYGTKKHHYFSHFNGYNSLLDEMQAAILRVKLKHFRQDQKERRVVVQRYEQGLKDTRLILPSVHPDAAHAWHQFVCRTPARNKLFTYLQKNNLPTAVHYPFPIHTMPAYTFLGYKQGDFPNTELASQEIFSLPLYPGLKISDQHTMIRAIIYFLASQRA